MTNLEQLMDSNWLESTASLMSAYSSRQPAIESATAEFRRGENNKIAALTYPSLDRMTGEYGSLTMEFQGDILSPVLTTGSEVMLRTLFTDLGSTLSKDFSALRETLDETVSSGDLSRLRQYNPAELSDWIVSNWFEYGKVPLASQFITLRTAENANTKKSLIAPSTLRTMLTGDMCQLKNEEMKNMLNMQGIFAFCKAVYTYLYQAERITLANFETGEVYLQAAVTEWHNNITYASLIDRTKISVDVATTLENFIKLILQPTYIVPPMITDSVNESPQQLAIEQIEANVLENNLASIKLEEEADLALVEMQRNEQLLVENRIALQSIQDAVAEEQLQQRMQTKEMELMAANFGGDREQTYEECLRNIKSIETDGQVTAILDSAPTTDDLNAVVPLVVETFMQDTVNDHSLVPSEGGFMSNLVSDVKTEFNEALVRELQRGVTSVPSIEPVQDLRAIHTDLGRLTDFKDLTNTQMQVVRHANSYEPDISAGTLARLSAVNTIEAPVEMMAIDLPMLTTPLSDAESEMQLQTIVSPWLVTPDTYKEVSMELDHEMDVLNKFYPSMDYLEPDESFPSSQQQQQQLSIEMEEPYDIINMPMETAADAPIPQLALTHPNWMPLGQIMTPPPPTTNRQMLKSNINRIPRLSSRQNIQKTVRSNLLANKRGIDLSSMLVPLPAPPPATQQALMPPVPAEITNTVQPLAIEQAKELLPTPIHQQTIGDVIDAAVVRKGVVVKRNERLNLIPVDDIVSTTGRRLVENNLEQMTRLKRDFYASSPPYDSAAQAVLRQIL